MHLLSPTNFYSFHCIEWGTQSIMCVKLTTEIVVVVVRFLTLPGTRGKWRQRRLLCTSICTALLSWITHAHLVQLSVTKRRPVHFILNPRHVEYEQGVLMVSKLSRPERDSNPRYPAWKLRALTTRSPSPRQLRFFCLFFYLLLKQVNKVVSYFSIALSLGVFGRLYSTTVSLPGHFLYHFRKQNRTQWRTRRRWQFCTFHYCSWTNRGLGGADSFLRFITWHEQKKSIKTYFLFSFIWWFLASKVFLFHHLSSPNIKIFRQKFWYFFHIFAQNIGYSVEPPRRGCLGTR